MDTTVEKKPFNRRAFVSLILIASGSILPVSGIMNHQLQFDTLTQARHVWMSIHNMAATIFMLSAITHVSLNWRPLVHYAKKAKGILLSKEAVAAFILVFGIMSLFASHAFHVR